MTKRSGNSKYEIKKGLSIRENSDFNIFLILNVRIQSNKKGSGLIGGK